MVQPIEARGQKSICRLLDREDWDSAVERLNELGVKLTHHRGRPVVNIEIVNIASIKWYKKQSEGKTPR